MNRTKVYFFIFVFIVLGMISLHLQLHRRIDGAEEKAPKKLLPVTVESFIKTESPRTQVVHQTPEQKQMNESVTPQFLEQFAIEAGQVGLPQKNFDDVEKRLQSWARHLDESEIRYLSFVIKDRSRNGDERALALDLLGRNQSSQSLTTLKDFVLNEGTGAGDSRARLDEEMIFKVQAVEEIAASSSSAEAISYLNEIQKRTEHSFVKDRAQRSLTSLKGLAPSLESQDNEALKKMIE